MTCQDVNLSTERLGANKAFTNKLWNAAKFILQNLPEASHTDHWAHLAAAKVHPPGRTDHSHWKRGKKWSVYDIFDFKFFMVSCFHGFLFSCFHVFMVVCMM